MTKEWVNPLLYHEVQLLDLSWIPVGWWRLVTEQSTRGLIPQLVNRRHFEVCVLSELLRTLSAGDIYIVGADRYGDPFPQL